VLKTCEIEKISNYIYSSVTAGFSLLLVAHNSNSSLAHVLPFMSIPESSRRLLE
jgi:hypothetical protein